ncbi:hypothetical protein HanRHA438_Chr00c69g0862271 [Helianthus annuus]|uniref:Uncharacterized protein n=1 Tax=Helianthus annuus TaxID=4232 RepID=A0A9K3NAA9_HELAN|nr:hypothetical protein HanXRQr2_Chr09g0410791 [Helianthus annuus]KAJ0527760.1 hypothetical protein HanHA300_Chr09g0337531 [Helianthus annuus]KAJ0544175.1 hypothetical protein HanHA89_Chr09g0358661 [Helianthus annuus]KAJ0709214.1 hypothetical protein HanLR1_Chr09g0337771 [Helianthus annuus]KAJ0713091.1 hypothetical protein HanOQP8_Chr09g0341921 [Helianthus annuus]
MNWVSIGVSRVILNPKLKKKSNKSTILGFVEGVLICRHSQTDYFN